MKLPEWLDAAADEIGGRRIDGEITRQEAVTKLRDAMIARDDRQFIASVLSGFAEKVADQWHQTHRADRPAAFSAQVQAELFPGLPLRLFVRPGQTKALALCTGRDLDMAQNMLAARTRNAIDGAEADRAAFDRAYAKVRPWLTGDVTVADVLAELADSAAEAAVP